MNRIRIHWTATLLALLVGAAGLSAESRKAQGFSNASLTGSYAAEEQGDGSVSAGLGVVHYDGKGKTTRRIIVNAPADDGGRRNLVFESKGEYEVNADGTGTITYANMISGGAATTDTFDFVITGTESSWILGRGLTRAATQLFAVQREAGVTVSLVTSKQKRIADQ